MTALRIMRLHHRLRRPRPFIDLTGFFLFFGISGVDHGREERMRRRFEQGMFTHHITAHVSPGLPPGRYRLTGVPEDVARRPWVVTRPGVAVATLSDDGWAALQAWQRGHVRDARAVPVHDA